MSASPREILDRILAEHGESWSEDDRKLVAAVAWRASSLAVDAASGRDVSKEWPFLQSSLASISAAAAQNAQNVVSALLNRILSAAMTTALGGLGMPR